MYPYPPHQNQDEPTMADVRGVLPGQRPPVDITVLDEPTSEVPVIKPASTPSDEAPEQESTAADTQTPATEAARGLEIMGREGNLGGAEEALAVLVKEIERLEGSLALLHFHSKRR